MWFVVPALLLAGAVVLYLRAWIAAERILRRQGGDHPGPIGTPPPNHEVVVQAWPVTPIMAQPSRRART